MTEELTEAVRKYLSATLRKLQDPSRERLGKESLAILKNRALELQMLVNELEDQPEFAELGGQTAAAFSTAKSSFNDLWQPHVGNFFRRSGFYAAVYDGKNPDAERTLNEYLEAFQRHKVKVTHLAPIELVEFDGSDFDFDTFKIKRFSPTELHQLVGNEVNEIFYEYAAINAQTLSQYWFIEITEDVVPPERGSGGLIDLSGRIQIRYSSFPKAVEKAIQTLSLYDWSQWSRYGSDEGDVTTGWTRFNIPFVLTVDDNILEQPAIAPDTSVLSTEPVPDPNTGEFVGEEPARLIDMCDDKASIDFRVFVRRAAMGFSSFCANQEAKPFMETALGYFLKAFFSEGLEQLLWHIAVVEALLGDREGEGLTTRLKKRLGSILGDTKEERKAIMKRFDALYAFRSDLVHANCDLGEKEIYLGHLREAHEIARKTLLWFLKYVEDISYQYMGNTTLLPTREDMIHTLDMDQGSRSRIKRLIEVLPDDFPRSFSS